MKVYIVKDYHEMSKKAASIIAAQAAMDPDSVLGLATGSTPVGAYEYLRKWSEEGTLDFSGIRTVNLDEYKGIAKATKAIIILCGRTYSIISMSKKKIPTFPMEKKRISMPCAETTKR